MSRIRTDGYFILIAALLNGCGLGIGNDAPVQQLEFSLDGVKIISPTIVRGDDASAWGREVYELSPTTRLMMRFETLSEHTRMITLDEGRRVIIRVRLAEPDGDGQNRAALSLCPVTKSWMMLATWEFAQPFQRVRWTTPGGDLGPCLAPFTPPPTVERPTDPADPQLVTFDVSSWFIDNVRGRDLNYGHILTATRPVRVNGDGSTPYSPRILFKRYVRAEPLPAP